MARRRYQKGSLMKRGDVWIGRWREDIIRPDGTHKRQRKSAVLGNVSELTQRLAQRQLDKLTNHINSTTYRPIPVCTLRQFAERWQAAVLPHYKPSTQATMLYHLGSHILPGLGDRQLNSINLEAVQTWAVNLHLAPTSTARVVTTLKALWNTAREWGYASHDLKGRLRLPISNRPRTRATLGVEEVKTLLEMAREPLRTILRTAFETGLRIGEVLGLQAEDVDTERKILWVRQSVWHSQI